MSTLSRVVFSTGKDDWRTPPDLFAALNAEFTFDIDVAATAENRLCALWFEDNERGGALVADWSLGGSRPPITCWCNPPYSRGKQAAFIAKASRARVNGVTTVMLLPARTDTQAFHNYIWDADRHQPYWDVEVRFLKGRLKFVGAENPAPFPSMLVIFRGA